MRHIFGIHYKYEYLLSEQVRSQHASIIRQHLDDSITFYVACGVLWKQKRDKNLYLKVFYKSFYLSR